MLNIQHLTKTYGGKKAVDDLSLHIAPGGTELVQDGVMLDELTPNARTVLAELGPKAQTADDLAAATGLAVQAVLAALMELEFAGAAVDNGGGRYTAA